MTDTPSLVPLSESSDVYLVLDELPTFGRVWRELSEESANKQAVLNLIASGEFHDPVRVIAFTPLKDGLAMLQGRLQKHC